MAASKEIKSAYLEDFQSHAKTKVELAPAGGLTVLCGPTDSGKTAVVRGLRLLFYNVPQGLEYIRVGRSTAIVALELADGTKVVRERSKSINRYRIVKPGQSPQVFEGFGLAVPREVQEATGVRTVSIGENLDLALNLSEQLDGPFLGKAVSGPAKAKILGALAGTEEVDEAQRAVQLDLHRAGQEERRIADETRLLDAKIAEYDYLPKLAEQISVLEGILTSIKETQSKLSTLEFTKARLDSVDAQRAQALGVLARWGGLSQAISHVEYAEGALAKMQVLSGYRASLASIASQREEWQKRLSRWANLPEAIGISGVAELELHTLGLLTNLHRDLLVTLEGKAKCEWVLMRWEGLPKAEILWHGTDEAFRRFQVVQTLRTRLINTQANMRAVRQQEARWAGLDDAQAVTSAIQSLQDRLSDLCSLRQTLIEIHGGRVVAEQNLSMHTKALGDAQSLYADTLIQLGTCPLCGSAVDPASLSLHIEEVA